MAPRLPARPVAAVGVLAALAGCGGASSAPSEQRSSAPPGQAPTASARQASDASAADLSTAGRRQAAGDLAPVQKPVPRTVRVPVLTYHRVHAYATERQRSVPDLTVEPASFRAEIAELSRGGFHSLTNRQLYDALFKGRPLPSKPVVLTFDDGYRDAVTDVLPVLKRYRMVGTFYVITGRLGGDEYLSPGDVRKLDAAGMDIGGHTSTHRDLTTLTSTELERETTGSRLHLEQIVGHPVPFFAYPFGRYDAAVVAAVRRAGYSLAFTTTAGSRLASTSPFTEPRLHVGRQTTPQGVVALAEGGR